MKLVNVMTRSLAIVLMVLTVEGQLFAQQSDGPARPPTPVTPALTPLALNQLIQEALDRNPEIRAGMHEVDAKRARVPQAGALPDPMLMVAQDNEGAPAFTTLGKFSFSEVNIGFSQDLLFFGKRGLKEQMASSEAEAQSWDFEFTRRQIIAEVKSAYYDLFYADKALEITRKNIDLMDKFAKIAEALYRVGKGNESDVLRADTELSRLKEREETFAQQRAVTEAQLDALLNRPPDTPLGKPAPIQKAAFTYSFDHLKAMAIENFPLLKRERRIVDSRASGLKLAEKQMYPDFGFNFTYHNRGDLRPYWTIGATASIPLYFSRKQRPAIDEAAAELAASRERYSNTMALLFFKLKDQYLRAVTSERLSRLYGEAITPQETLALDSALAGYETGKVDFLSVLDGAMKLLGDELSYFEQLVKYQKALAGLEPFVGVELTE